jgi:hypothetical protein
LAQTAQPQDSYNRIAELAVTETRVFSFQANGKPNQYQLIANPKTFGVKAERLQSAAEQFAVQFTEKPSGNVILLGEVDAIAAAVEHAKL